MAYTLYLRNDATGEGASSKFGTITYTITPDYGTPIYPGDTITVSGTAKWNMRAIKSITCWITSISENKNGIPLLIGNMNISIAKGSSGKFTVSATVPQITSASRFVYTSGGLSFTVWDRAGGSTNSPYGDHDTTTDDDTNKLFFCKYHLDPIITSVSFDRTNDSGASVNDGNRVTCRAFKLSITSPAVAGDITKMTISVTAEGSTSPIKTVNLSASQLNSMLSTSGYKESTPALFSGVNFELSKEYYIDIIIGDAYEQITYRYTINRAFCLVDFSRKKNGGFAVGRYSSSTDDTPKFEVAESHESFLYGGIFGVNNYVTGEVETGGHWIDRKPIFRYTLALKSQKVNTTTKYPLDVGIGNLIRIFGWVVNSGGTYLPLPYVNTSGTYAIEVSYLGSNEVRLITGSSRSFSSGYVVLEYTKATVTGDSPIPGPSIAEENYFADEGVARADYIAMMTGIDIPIDPDTDATYDEPEPIDPPGIESELTPAHSKKFKLVQLYYIAGVWNEAMVNAAVGRWITAAEAADILGTEDTLERM